MINEPSFPQNDTASRICSQNPSQFTSLARIRESQRTQAVTLLQVLIANGYLEFDFGKVEEGFTKGSLDSLFWKKEIKCYEHASLSVFSMHLDSIEVVWASSVMNILNF